jgi:hypothetical protein
MSTLNESILKNNSNSNSNNRKDRSRNAFQHYIDEKLEKYHTQLMESIDKKFFYLTNKDTYFQVQKEELNKLIQKLNPIGNHLQNYQTLFKLNEFLANNNELTTRIRNQFAEFLTISTSDSITNRYYLN